MKNIKACSLATFCASGLLLLAFTHSAFAAGTASGTDIINQATVAYDVGGINQSTLDSNTVTFKVDAKVDLTVTAIDSAAVPVTPGAQNQALAFSVTNDGNEPFGFDLAFETGSTTDFTTAGLAFYSSLANATAGTNSITETGSLTPDATFNFWLAGNIPTTAENSNTANYNIKATAKLANGNTLPAQLADDPATKQYVYADDAGTFTNDVARDKAHSATSPGFIVASAVLSIFKSSSVIWDPINLGSNPLHIPGAIIEYTIHITNAASAQTASAIAVTDVLESNLAVPTDAARQYAAGSSIKVTSPNLYGGAATNLTDASDADEATVTGQTVTVTGLEISGGESATVNILAEIK